MGSVYQILLLAGENLSPGTACWRSTRWRWRRTSCRFPIGNYWPAATGNRSPLPGRLRVSSKLISRASLGCSDVNKNYMQGIIITGKNRVQMWWILIQIPIFFYTNCLWQRVLGLGPLFKFLIFVLGAGKHD